MFKVNPEARKAKPIRSASYTVKELVKLIHETNISYRELSKQAGCDHSVITHMIDGKHSTSILTIEAIAQVIGAEVIVRWKDDPA